MRHILRFSILGLLAMASMSLLPQVQAFGPAPHAQVPGLQIPTLPDTVPVQLDAKTTAFLALDFQDTNCPTRPSCVASLPAVAAALASARAAGVPVVYTVVGTGTVVPEVTPQGETPLLSFGPDKFFNTNLDETLKQSGITTLVMTGTASNAAILYTGFGAGARRYTMVVATDGISAASDFDDFVARYQLLTRTGSGNAQNDPLKPNAVTLSRTDLISYK